MLGLLDLAEIRKETFKNYQLENSFATNERIRKMRLYFVLLMAKILDYKLHNINHRHINLVDNLEQNDVLSKTCFISTNYDILIDNALSYLYVTKKRKLDYGIEFTNYENLNDWKRPNKNAIKLLKIHGSLNWLFCPTCNNVTLTQYEKGIMVLLYDQDKAQCKKCQTIRMPIIVPPTFYKDISTVFLSSVWNKAEKYLSDVEHIIFCGYSFPDSDIHIKYLLKRIQTNKNKHLKITVLNHSEGKKEYTKNEELVRYERFFGTEINFLEYGFKEFSENPMQFYN